MQIRATPWWLWLVPIAFLIIATQKIPYGYYNVYKAHSVRICGLPRVR